MPDLTMPRKILVFESGNRAYTVEVPDDAKITFGPTIPFQPRERYQPADRSYSLRIYKGSKENLLAVFGNVQGFRDLSLKIEDYDPELIGDTGEDDAATESSPPGDLF